MRVSSVVLTFLALGAVACQPAAKEPEAAPKAAAAEGKKADDKATQTEEEKQAARQQRLAEVAERFDNQAKEEEARWTPALREKVAALVAEDFADAKGAMAAILKGPHRKPGNPDRDPYRRPTETMAFLGLTPNMTVVEVGAGTGWYTEVLAPLLRKQGKLRVVSYDPNGPADSFGTLYGQRLKRFLAAGPEAYSNVEWVSVVPPERLSLGEPNSADLALAIREMHNWHRNGFLPAYLKAIFDVLKPGGVLGVVQHRAAPDADAEKSAGKGYLPEAWLVQQVEAAGFKLAEKSEINANPKDTKNYEKGVWTLPPSLSLGDQEREKYIAIGESDRMTLKFVKPAG